MEYTLKKRKLKIKESEYAQAQNIGVGDKKRRRTPARGSQRIIGDDKNYRARGERDSEQAFLHIRQDYGRAHSEYGGESISGRIQYRRESHRAEDGVGYVIQKRTEEPVGYPLLEDHHRERPD